MEIKIFSKIILFVCFLQGYACAQSHLTFQSSTFDFGKVPFEYGAHGGGTFPFKNTGNDTIIINDVHTSCGCDVAFEEGLKTKFVPNEEGKIVYSFDRGIARAFHNDITIITNDSETTVLHIIWEVLPDPNNKTKISPVVYSPMPEIKIDSAKSQLYATKKNAIKKHLDTLEGYHKIYNEYKQITQDGFFKNGKLIEGREYFYGTKVGPEYMLGDEGIYLPRPDSNYHAPKGHLRRVDVYTNGKIVFRFSGDFKEEKIYNGQKEVFDKSGYVTYIKLYKDGMGAGSFSGDLILYMNGQIMQKGFFKNGTFETGEKRIYAADGRLLKTEIYKDGKYLGDEPLPSDADK